MAIKKDVKNFKKVISAGFIVYRNTSEGPKFLLLYRGRDAWDMPRGKMSEGERSLQTAFREVQEETGLSSRDLKLNKDFKRVYEKFPYMRDGEGKVFKIVIFYLAETKKSQIKLSHEHEGYAWFRLNEAEKHMRRYKVRKALLKRAWEFIKREN